MSRTLHFILLAVYLTFTAGFTAVGQIHTQQSQETVNALANQHFAEIDARLEADSKVIADLEMKLEHLNSSIEKIYGIGIGFGICLTALQAVLFITTARGKPHEPVVKAELE